MYDVLDLAFGLVDQAHALVAETVGDLGLTSALANALWKIEPPAAPTMRQLAASLHCDPSTVTFIADRLQDKGLITREPDPANRRTKIIRLTERGREVRAQLATAMVTRSGVGNLSATELGQLKRLLAKTLTNTRAEPPPQRASTAR